MPFYKPFLEKVVNEKKETIYKVKWEEESGSFNSRTFTNEVNALACMVWLKTFDKDYKPDPKLVNEIMDKTHKEK